MKIWSLLLSFLYFPAIILSAEELKPEPFPHFTDITFLSGISAEKRRAQSASWGDYNNDGLVDLYICNKNVKPNKLYKNLGNGRFRDVTENAGVGGKEFSIEAIWIDIDSDKFLDLFLINLFYENKLYRNKGDGTFEEIFDKTGLSKGITAWVDINKDGKLDVFVSRGYSVYPARPETVWNTLFINKGNFHFVEEPEHFFLKTNKFHTWVNWNDWNLDGLPDLFAVESEQGTIDNCRYTPEGTFVGANFPLSSAGAHCWADLDNDGDMDAAILSFLGKEIRILENKAGDRFAIQPEKLKIEDNFRIFKAPILSIDIDNDGLLDLVVRTHVPDNTFMHYINVYKNKGDLNFELYPNAIPIPKSDDLVNTAWCDFDNDGDMDFLAILHNDLRLFRNDGLGHSYLKVTLIGNESQADGVGSRIRIISEDKNFSRWIGLGQNNFQETRGQMTIGMLQEKEIPRISVFWPSGIQQDSLNPPLNKNIVLKEPFANWFIDMTERARLDDVLAKSMGGSCSDYDGDGDMDFIITNHDERSILYENLGQGTFRNGCKDANIATNSNQMGSLFFDFNNDSYDDLFLLGWYAHQNLFFQNNENGKFTDYSKIVQISTDQHSCLSVVSADFNNDGYLDIYEGRLGKNNLLINQNGKLFNNFTEMSQTGDTLLAHGMVTFDYDNDGDMDIYVANTRGGEDAYLVKSWPNVLFRNNGNLQFENVTDAAGVTCNSNSKGVCVGDYDNDGDFDLFVANDDTTNILFKNNGDGTFSDVTAFAGVGKPLGAHGCQFVDFDNDGFLDLYVAGSSYIPEKHDYTTNKTHPDVLYLNKGNGTFSNITKDSGLEANLAATPHILVADFNNDGFMDLYTSNSIKAGMKPAPNKYFQNRGNTNNWIKLKLVGYQSNKNAIGAKVQVLAGKLSMWQQVSFGSGFGSNRCTDLIFGIGKEEKVDKIQIIWPSGVRETLRGNLKINELNTLIEPYDLWAFSLSRTMVWSVWGWTWKLGLLAIALVVLGFLIPLIRGGIQMRHLENRAKRFLNLGVSKRHLLEVRIDLMPHKADYLIVHYIRPSSSELYHLDVFDWGRQEEKPYLIRADKISVLNQRVQKLVTAHLAFIKEPDILPESILDELKFIGDKIYNYLGLRSFFDTIFQSDTLRNVHINFIVDSATIPWYLAYDSISNKFLCEQVPYSFAFGFEKSSTIDMFSDTAVAESKNLEDKNVIMLYSDWKGHEKELTEVEHEIKDLERIFKDNSIEPDKIYANCDQFISLLESKTKTNADIRIIHYSGHIEHNLLALGPDDYFDSTHMEKSYGIKLDSGPLVFLNGCESSPFWQKEGELVTNFLKSGAATCIVTHAKLPEASGRRFAALFYEFYIEKKLTAADALRQTRLSMAKDKRFRNSLSPEYDITRYFYNIYGDPLLRF